MNHESKDRRRASSVAESRRATGERSGYDATLADVESNARGMRLGSHKVGTTCAAHRREQCPILSKPQRSDPTEVYKPKE
jgi:hypothetical protein